MMKRLLSTARPLICFDTSHTMTPSVIGWKAFNLFKISNAGIRVPPSVAITTEAFEAWHQSAGESSGEVDVAVSSSQLNQRPIPRKLNLELRRSWEWVQPRCIVPFGVSVRSSASAEDLPTASFAGQFESFLNVRSFTDFVSSVRNVWLSAFSDQVKQYMAQHKLDAGVLKMGVLVQPTVPAEVSGVAFGCDPVTKQTDVVHIEATLGLGDILVRGKIKPDVWAVSKERITILSSTARTKDVQSSCGGAPWPDVIQIPVAEERANRPCMTARQVIALARTIIVIEKMLTEPVDVEWCIHEGQLSILQARPVTT